MHDGSQGAAKASIVDMVRGLICIGMLQVIAQRVVMPMVLSPRGLRHYATVAMAGSNFHLAQDSNELFDLYLTPPDKELHNAVVTPAWGMEFNPPKRIDRSPKERGLVHRDGDWHRSVHVWLAQTTNGDRGKTSCKVLLQRRSPYKDTHPNLLDVSCAGHVDAGSDTVETATRELQEELGGNGIMQDRYEAEDVRRSKVCTVTSSIQGQTEKFGRFLCREYQDVFLLWWPSDEAFAPGLFSPQTEEEVSGFELMDAEELVAKLRSGDKDLVPRSIAYIGELSRALGVEQ